MRGAEVDARAIVLEGVDGRKWLKERAFRRNLDDFYTAAVLSTVLPGERDVVSG